MPNSLKASSERSPFSNNSRYGLYTWAMSFPQEKHLTGIIMIGDEKKHRKKNLCLMISPFSTKKREKHKFYLISTISLPINNR